MRERIRRGREARPLDSTGSDMSNISCMYGGGLGFECGDDCSSTRSSLVLLNVFTTSGSRSLCPLTSFYLTTIATSFFYAPLSPLPACACVRACMRACPSFPRVKRYFHGTKKKKKGGPVVCGGDLVHDAGRAPPVRVHGRQVHLPPHPSERVRLSRVGCRQRQRQESCGEAAAGVWVAIYLYTSCIFIYFWENGATGYTLVELRHSWVPFPQILYAHC